MGAARVFYGWWVTLAFAVMVFLSTGVRFTIGPFLKPMVADLEIDRASFSLVVGVGLFLYGAFVPIVGWVADRVGARPVVVTGGVLFALSTAAVGLATRLWHLYVTYGVLVALGLAMTAHAIASAVVSRWFTRRRATALSVLGAASMGGLSLLVPVTTWLILVLGWRATYAVLGAVLLVTMVPLAAWVVRDSPESMGLQPDGVAGEGGHPTGAVAERTDLSAAVQVRAFWQLAGTLGACGFSMSLLSAHGVPMLTDHGYHPMVASWALGLLGGTSIVFSLGLGALGDRIGCRPVLAFIYAGRAAALVGLFLVRDHPVALLLVAALGGATMAGAMAMTSTLTAAIFGRYSVGSVFGMMILVHQVAAALGSWLGGALFEATGGYGAAFGLGTALLAAAALASPLIDERTRPVPRLVPLAEER